MMSFNRPYIFDEEITPVKSPLPKDTTPGKLLKNGAREMATELSECDQLKASILSVLEQDRIRLEAKRDAEIAKIMRKYEPLLAENARQHQDALEVVRDFKEKLQRVSNSIHVSPIRQAGDGDDDKDDEDDDEDELKETTPRTIHRSTASTKSKSSSKKKTSQRSSSSTPPTKTKPSIASKMAIRTAPMPSPATKKTPSASSKSSSSASKSSSKKRSEKEEEPSKVFKRVKENYPLDVIQKDWRESRPKQLTNSCIKAIEGVDLFSQRKIGSYREPSKPWSSAVRLMDLSKETGQILLSSNTDDDDEDDDVVVASTDDFPGLAKYFYLFPPRFETCVECGIFHASEEPGVYCDGCNVFVHQQCMDKNSAPPKEEDPYFCRVCCEERQELTC